MKGHICLTDPRFLQLESLVGVISLELRQCEDNVMQHLEVLVQKASYRDLESFKRVDLIRGMLSHELERLLTTICRLRRRFILCTNTFDQYIWKKSNVMMKVKELYLASWRIVLPIGWLHKYPVERFGYFYGVDNRKYLNGNAEAAKAIVYKYPVPTRNDWADTTAKTRIMIGMRRTVILSLVMGIRAIPKDIWKLIASHTCYKDWEKRARCDLLRCLTIIKLHNEVNDIDITKSSRRKRQDHARQEQLYRRQWLLKKIQKIGRKIAFQYI